jgi:CheY-like chemotaxis protein
MGLIYEIIQYPVLIVYLAGANNYTWLHFTDGRKQLVSKPLSYFEKRFPTFLRVHKTTIINPQYVWDWQCPLRRRMAGTIRMQGGTVLPVGRRRWQEVIKKLTFSEQKEAELEGQHHYRSVIFLTDDEAKALLLRQSLEQQCLDCLVHIIKPTVPLAELMQTLPDNELPVLILIDARTGVTDRLATLHQLKKERRTAFIPALLLIDENAGDVIEKGYAAKANSVVPVPNQASSNHHTMFVEVLAQVIRYWLSVTALPEPVPVTS